MKTRVVHVRAGEPYDVYVGRPSRWGNPFRVGRHGSREEVMRKYADWVQEEIKSGCITKDELLALHGKVLGCWCKPAPCHGDVLASIVDRLALEDSKTLI